MRIHRAAVALSSLLAAHLALPLAGPAAAQEDPSMTTSAVRSPPLVIAHRGASGHLPEHTLEAYAAAHAMGADSLEPDLVRTSDGEFICLHDIHLEDTTDVEQRFPDRHREDGRWYAADFSLAEIKSLRAHERLPGRFPQDSTARFEVPTFREMVELVQSLNRSTGRVASVYPELKEPAWHRKQGLPMEEAFLTLAKELGFEGADAPIWVQCFEREPLQRMRELGSRLPQIMLLSDGEPWQALMTDQGLAGLVPVANGIGPSKVLIEEDPELVQRAHHHGLEVHPYTFRADDLGPDYRSLEEELERFVDRYGVDGFFTDHADRGVRWVESRRTGPN